MECPATKRRKLEGGVFREVEFDKCFTLGREDFPDLDSDTLKNVSEQHVVLTDASWDHFTGYNIGMGPIMVHHPLHHERAQVLSTYVLMTVFKRTWIYHKLRSHWTVLKYWRLITKAQS